jgi:hypothetical protein
MALYQDEAYLTKVKHAEFDKQYPPGATVGWSGIYKCVHCGHEAVHTHNKPLPPQDHHVHPSGQGKILWRLVVTDSRPPNQS